MKATFNRRQWLRAAGVGFGAVILPTDRSSAQDAGSIKPPTAGGVAPSASAESGAGRDWLASFPRQPSGLVQEIVGASHARIERVKELLGTFPELAKCAWDWGFGDWESPIGAAGHTGQREIVALLMEHGASPNLFTHAMLGDLEVVRRVIEAHPALLKLSGPHGLTLLHHAHAGGEQAARVVEYLRSKGSEEFTHATASKYQIETLVGEFHLTDGHKVWIEPFKEGLAIRDESGRRVLFPLADGAWHPAGAHSVRIRFEPKSGPPTELVLSMGGRTLRGPRA